MTSVIVHEEMVNEMWSEYLENVDDYDKRLTDGWKDDANGVLVFVSLHPLAPVSIKVMIWEPDRSFSPQLSHPSSLKATNSYHRPILLPSLAFLLGQLSQQFAGFANSGTYVQPRSYPSSPPSTSIICVNILWLLSFLLSIISALFATLMLQWARVYIDLPQTPERSEGACSRSVPVLFFGMEKYRDRVHTRSGNGSNTPPHFLCSYFSSASWYSFSTIIFKTVAVVIFNRCRVVWNGILCQRPFLPLPRLQQPVSHPNVKPMVVSMAQVPSLPMLCCLHFIPLFYREAAP